MRIHFWFARAAGLAMLASLVGCVSVGPDYHVPANAVVRSPSANGTLHGADDPAISLAPLPDDWWRLYDDPKLNELVQQALHANTDLRVAAANLRRSFANLQEVKAEHLVQGDVSAQTGHQQFSGEAYLSDEKVPVLSVGSYGISASYLIDIFGKLERADEAALAAAQASQAALDSARVMVVSQTVLAYVQGCAATHELEVAEHQLALQESAVALTRKLVDAGRNQPAELPQALSQAETLRAGLPQFRAEQAAAAYRLSVMLGQPPGASSLPQAECREEPRLTQPLPVGDGAALLKRRPDIRQAERDLGSATAKIGVATADLYPSIRLGATGGVTGTLADLGMGSTRQWSFASVVTWNFPTNGARARIHGAEAGSDAALARFDGVVLKSLEETQTALARYTNELGRNRSLRDARDQAQVAAREQRRLYQGGRVPYLMSLDADRTLANAEAALANSDAQVAFDQVSVFQSLGGGWQSSDPSTHDAQAESVLRQTSAEALPTTPGGVPQHRE
ncbi:efflux transporter outer membrane subunit [Paraburkholderia fungorum]|uniref:efflux transporter outer membrane subunit n=1 Tax=Paraburkholderia fungorum TaxID=134537 RepID=UPI0038BAE688